MWREALRRQATILMASRALFTLAWLLFGPNGPAGVVVAVAVLVVCAPGLVRAGRALGAWCASRGWVQPDREQRRREREALRRLRSHALRREQSAGHGSPPGGYS